MPTELKQRLEEAAATPSSGPNMEAARKRAKQRTWSRRALAAFSTIAVAGSSWALVTNASLFADRATAPTNTPDGAANPQPRVAASIRVGDLPGSVVIGEDGVWVAVSNDEVSTHELVRIDPITDEVVARTPVDGPIDSVALGEGSIWASVFTSKTGASVLRIDPETNEVTATIHGAGGDLALGDGSLWAVEPPGADSSEPASSIVRVDTATNQVESTIPLDGAVVDIEFGEGAAWVLEQGDSSDGVGTGVVKVDPATDRIVSRAEIDAHYIRIAAGAGSVWVPAWRHEFADVKDAQDAPVVARIDPGSAAVAPEPIAIHTTFRPFAVDADGVWFVAGPEEPSGLCRLSASTYRVEHCIDPGGLAEVFLDPAAMSPSQQTIWVSNTKDTVTRIDL